ncbi:glycosyltransferase family 39 protein [Massilia solisilvae]|uniref:Glycosyltransferase family 39 protein n=1 Tax=Massilia solisilvae TaxID=1811225 RepID=A0ABT2BDY9_9BURK|nr:glycosyltransferase family 39 protein [Massilia solisilvae]
MTQPPLLTDRSAWKILVGATFVAICAWLLVRSGGLYPSVFADEWYYDKLSRLQPLHESVLPSWLYLWLFSASSMCGPRFYDCVHAGNVAFFAAAIPFVYLIARHYTGRAVAAFIALLAMLAPFNLYTAYFMPESMYFFGFCVLTWIALTRAHWPWARYAATTGIVLGLMSLVKVHALFLVPALCLFLLYTRWMGGGRWLRDGARAVALALACVAAVRFGLGYLLGGRSALDLFGNFYGGAVHAAGSRSLFALVAPALVSAGGHLMALALLLPLPLAMVAASLLRPPPRAQAGKGALLQLYAFLMLGSAAGVTVLFTASIANAGLNNEGLRLHLRYYDFIFPLLWLVVAAAAGQRQSEPRTRLRWAIALVVAAGLAAAISRLGQFSPSPVDGPDLYAITVHKQGVLLLAALDALLLFLWARGRAVAAPLFLFAVLPATVLCGAFASTQTLKGARVQDLAERAADYARAHIPPAERDQVTVAGNDTPRLMRTQFRLDAKDSMTLLLAPDAPIEHASLPTRSKWLLVLGNHPLPDGVTPLYRNDEFSLVRIHGGHRRVGLASLAAPFGQGLIASASGLSWAESWGRWSDADKVVIRFNMPLPRHLRVVLKAQAYDVNTQLPFTMHVGERSEQFKVGWAPQDVSVAFETGGAEREIVIDVPHPVSPTVHGQPDPRRIGIGISEIEIGDTGGDGLANN